MDILGRAVPSLVRRGPDNAKAELAEGKWSAGMEDRRKKPRTAAEEEAVREFRRLLADMLGEPPPDESQELDSETQATRDEDFTKPADATFAMTSGEAAQVNGAATDESQHAEDIADLVPTAVFVEDATDVPGEDQIFAVAVTETGVAESSSVTAFQDTADVPEEDPINWASVIEPEPVDQETLLSRSEKQTTASSPDPEWVRIKLKDGRCLDAWRRSSPSTGQQLLLLDVVTTFDSQGKEISGSPGDSFTYRSEVISINGSKVQQVQRKVSGAVNPSSNDETPIEKERY